MMNTGISEDNLKILTTILAKYLKQGIVILYGSRAKGSFIPTSDIDLVMKNSNISNLTLDNLIEEIEESNFPYICDISLFENIKNHKLLTHINNFGVVLKC